MILDQHQKEFIKMLKANCGQYRPHQVFSDFCEMAAIGLNLPVDHGPHFEERRTRFLDIRKRYTEAEFLRFDSMSKCVVDSLTLNFKDCLGDIFMELELGNHWKGQFFTPYTIAQMMAQITYPDPSQARNIHGMIRVSDPCSGAGAMVIAMAQHVMEAGGNYQQEMHVTAQDVDITAVHMTYIQLTLLYVPATVIHGNTLKPDQNYPRWHTAAHCLDNWEERLRRAAAVDAMMSILRTPEQPDIEPVHIIERPAPDFDLIRERHRESLQNYQNSQQLGLF